MALFGDVIAGAVLGLKNILTLTGDHTALGDHKKGRPVYDIDSTQFAEMLSMMIDEGTDYEGNENKGGKIEIKIAEDYAVSMTGTVTRVAEGVIYPEMFDVGPN